MPLRRCSAASTLSRARSRTSTRSRSSHSSRRLWSLPEPSPFSDTSDVRRLSSASPAVAVAFVVLWLVVRSVAREQAQGLIAAGADSVVLDVVARERRRLASRGEREALARSLASLHRDALRWNRTHPHFRPLFGVAQLRHVSREVDALVAALRRDRVRVQGVALTSRFLSDGQSSPLYANEIGPLREELNRIRFLLECADRAALDDAHAHRAAA